MSSEILRKAASLMRERAEAAMTSLSDNMPEWHSAAALMGDGKTEGDAEHIASWHPAVALAVADWLEAEATSLDAMERFQAATVKQEAGWTARGAGISVREHDDGTLSISTDTSAAALTVARAYLGSDS